MKMPDSEAKRKWMKENTHVFSVKLMKKSEQDIIEYLDAMLEKGIGKGTVLKLALREYMQNHPVDSIPKNEPIRKPKTKFTYGMRLRGFSPGAQPKGVKERRDDLNGEYYDIIVYDHPLTDKEIQQYELDELD